jgi:2-amino-4-hydroxy-6-hydroxymethyldihydropteridine diphosphokinase
MILIALGASLPSAAGEPKQTLRAALADLAARGVTVQRQSGFYTSEAWPDPSDPPFINAVAHVRTVLPPSDLLRVLHTVEAKFGRQRELRNAPRTLDLDLLDYDGRVESGGLELPHPRMADRLFVLLPLRDVAPEWRHPITGRTVDDLIAAAPPAQVSRLATG